MKAAGGDDLTRKPVGVSLQEKVGCDLAQGG